MSKIRYTHPGGRSVRIPSTAFVRNVVRDEPGIFKSEMTKRIRRAKGQDDSPEFRRNSGRIVANAIDLGRIHLKNDRLYLGRNPELPEDQEEEQ